MPKKAPKVHPRSWLRQMARRWQTKYGELCQVLHEIRKNKEITDDEDIPPSFREPAAEEVQRLECSENLVQRETSFRRRSTEFGTSLVWVVRRPEEKK